MRAEKIQKKAGGFGFEFNNIEDVYAKVLEELDELKQACAEKNSEHIREEYGDLLFSVVNLGRFIGADPETALTGASNKFINRFERVEKKAAALDKDIADMSEEELDSLWNSIK